MNESFPYALQADLEENAGEGENPPQSLEVVRSLGHGKEDSLPANPLEQPYPQ